MKIVSATGRDKGLDKDKDKTGQHKEEANDDFHLSSKCLVDQLPNTVSVSFRHVSVSSLMPVLQPYVACSAGSACHAEGDFPLSYHPPPPLPSFFT